MSSHVEQIKEKLSIVDVVGSYVALEQSGANFKAKCPFHNERSASFFISPVRNSYYCFGCGAKGDIFSFVQQFEGLDFVGALRVLAQRAGVELKREKESVRTERERLYLAMEYATLFFQRELAVNAKAKEYVVGRGLKEETIKDWRLGYAPLEWRKLGAYLAAKGVTASEMEKVGLTKRSGDSVYDRFRGRIMFPIFDSSGRVVGFSGRQFESDGTEAKYLNSPETPLFEKSKILYGYHKAKLDIRKSNYALLVEGQMDLLMSHQAGFGNAVATSGTALTEAQLGLLKRLSEKLVICYDGDDAGIAAAKRGWTIALALGMDVRVVSLPDKKDPADIASSDPELLKKLISEARHSIDVELERVSKTVTDKRERMLAVEKEVLPMIAELQSVTEKSYFVSQAAHEIGVQEPVVWEALKKIEAKRKVGESAVEVVEKAVQHSRRVGIERRLWGIVFWQEKQETKLIDLEAVKKEISEMRTAELDVDKLRDELIFEAELSFNQSNDLKRHVDELLLNLREEYVRDKFNEAMHDLHAAERAKDTDKTLVLLKKCQELAEELKTISKQRAESQPSNV